MNAAERTRVEQGVSENTDCEPIPLDDMECIIPWILSPFELAEHLALALLSSD